MTLIITTSVVALLSTGLLSGILLGNRMGASIALPNLPDSSFVRFQQVVHLHYVRIMPVLQIAAILSSLALVFLLRNSVRGLGFVLLAASAVGSIVVFAITLTVNIPVNKKLMTWNAATPPENVRELWGPWDKGNTVRTILAVMVFVLEALAVSLTAPTGI